MDERQWSRQLFGHCDLGDVRRTRRLVDVAARLACRAGQSLARCCQGDPAAVLGSYRLIENASVAPEAIAEAGFEAMAGAARTTSGELLAVEDSTSVVYAHAVADQLGTTGSQQQPKHRGYLVHSVLLLEASSERTLGLVEQRRWCREDAGYGRKHARKQRAYEDKESYKWQQASARMAGRMGCAMARTISVCDRESDVYEYLHYKHEQGQRYVVRAQSDRGLTQSGQTLFGALAGEQAWQYEAIVEVTQRGGRAARKARVQVCGRRLEVKPPADRGKQAVSLPINVVLVREPAGGEHEPLHWVLLTSEPVESVEQVRRIVRYYELRWRIEEYHKAWKSGVGVERLRQQSAASLERMLAITAFVAVRLLQLRESLPSGLDKGDAQAELSCDQILETEEWKVLWLTVQKTPLPATPPTARWACLALATLGGFTDTKRTGRPGWATLWHGWQVLQERVVGFRVATGMATEM
ncbi:IS4 family transposase [Frateuria defendens]|uniref:IS4 family transposase n=1 Tax=Frateuria defendens TaxID=2219559 RepID=UPI00066FBC60|nr:IS4 family transposase [Frateuria defendens]